MDCFTVVNISVSVTIGADHQLKVGSDAEVDRNLKGRNDEPLPF
jgi:hypothetical protein